MAIRLLIADVDGTLVTPEKVVTEQARKAVLGLRDHGVLFAVTSGRPPRGLASLVGPLELTAPLAAFNGGVFIKPDLKTVLAQRTIPPSVAKHVVDYLLRAGLDVWVYQGTEWFLRDPHAPRVARERSNVGFDPIVIRDLNGVLDAPIKIVGVSEHDPALLQRCEAELSEQLGVEASAVRSHRCYLDVTHPEANKGMVVREAAQLLNLPLDQVSAIGDMPNDLPMLRVAGLPIAMGNASPEVQAVARHVTRANDDEGFAHAVESFILGSPPLATTALGLPPRVRACVFGLDSVLTRPVALHAATWKRLFDGYLQRRAQALHEPFVPFDAADDYAVYIHGKPPTEAVTEFLASRGIELPARTVSLLAQQRDHLMLEVLREKGPEGLEGAARYLQAAREGGLRTVALCSNPRCQQILTAVGLGDSFDAVVVGELTSGLYVQAAKAAGVDTEEMAVLEDEVAGVSAARAAHAGYIVGIDRAGDARALRRGGADWITSDLTSLLSDERAGRML
jgi:Cof subfamily protein (haloacid dehalogenase superfamily)/HAD superfamily hydrolase (TIGR01509 family)